MQREKLMLRIGSEKAGEHEPVRARHTPDKKICKIITIGPWW